MPRLSRLDAPGILHHVMIRGIERKKIFTKRVAVGIPVAQHPPHRSGLEELPHPAPALGNNAKAH